MKILITNDDSHRSPLLSLAVEYFRLIGEVSLVVPLHEQSWTGKSMSRFEPLHVQSGTICGQEAFSISGTPADCVNCAVYNILPSKPDLIVSGINAGFNLGVGFILSSGTVGACIEGNLAGVPAIALSQAFDSETRNQYSSDYMINAESLVRFKEQTFSILDRFMAKACAADVKNRFLTTPVTWNINFPSTLKEKGALRATPIGHSRYTRVFNETPGTESDPIRVFRHSSINEIKDPSFDCDTSLVSAGYATLSILDVWGIGATGKSGDVVDIYNEFRDTN